MCLEWENEYHPFALDIRAVISLLGMLCVRAPKQLHVLQRDVRTWLWDVGYECAQLPESAIFLTAAIDYTSFRSSSMPEFFVHKENENIKRKYNTEKQVLSCHKDVVNMKSVGFFTFLLIWYFAKNCADFTNST